MPLTASPLPLPSSSSSAVAASVAIAAIEQQYGEEAEKEDEVEKIAEALPEVAVGLMDWSKSSG